MSFRLHLISLVGIGALSACGGEPAPLTPAPSISASSAPAATATSHASSTVAPAGDWGPLAVWDDAGSSGGDFALLSGTLAIEGECVTVADNTLAWAASQVRWVPETNSLLFNDPIARVVIELGPGDEVELGGGGSAGGETPWVAAPDEGCPGELFVVGNIGSVNGIEP